MNEAIILYCDNSGEVANSKEPRSHKRDKHIERKCHLIRETVHRDDINVIKIASEINKINFVDPLTKRLAEKTFKCHLEGMSLKEISHML